MNKREEGALKKAITSLERAERLIKSLRKGESRCDVTSQRGRGREGGTKRVNEIESGKSITEREKEVAMAC